MAVELCDANGSLGQLATISGYVDTVAYVEKNGGPALQHLVKEGYVEKKYVVSELSDILDRDMPDDVRTVLENLQQLVKKADEIVIVTQ